MNNKKVYAVLSAAAIGTIFSLAINGTVDAATRDFTNIKTGQVFKASDWKASDTAFNQLVDALADNPDDYVVEFTGNQYKYEGLLDQLINRGTKTLDQAFQEALQDTDLIYNGGTSTIAVSSISAINSTTVQVKLSGVPTATVSTASFSFSGGAISGLTKVDDTTYNLTVPVMTSGTTYTVTGASPLAGTATMTYTAVASTVGATFTPVAAQSVASGQSLVSVGTLNLTAGNAETQVTGLKLNRSGLSADTDISGITIWDGSNKLNVPAVISNGVADITFTSPLTISAGQSKALTIKLNFATAATVGAQVNLSINSSGDIKTTGTVNATFPMASNTFTVAAVNLGTLAVANSADTPTQSLDAGTTGARLAKFDFTAGSNESQKLKSITFTQNGSVGDSDVINLKLYKDGVQVGATANVSNRKVTFTFDNGLDIAAGTTLRLDLKGDVVTGSGRTVRFGINDVNDVQATGNTYGTTIVSSGTFDGTSVAINSGSLLVSRDKDTPSAGLISGTVNDQAFLKVKVEAVGEPVQVRTISLQGVATGGAVTDFTDLKVLAGDTVVANVNNPFTLAAQAKEITLSTPVTVTPGTPVYFTVTADLSGRSADDTYHIDLDSSDTPAGDAIARTFTGVGTVSGKNITFNTLAADIAGNTKTVGNLQVAPTVSPTVTAGNVFPNQTAYPFTSFTLGHNLSESVLLYQVRVDVGVGTAGQLANLKLTNADGSKVLTNVIATPAATGNILVFNDPIEVAAGQVPEFKVVADTTSAATATFRLDVNSTDSVARVKSNGTSVTIGAVKGTSPVATVAAAGPSVTVTNTDGKAATVVKGQKDAVVGEFKFTEASANAQDTNITKLKLTPVVGHSDAANSLDNGSFTNIRVVDSNGNVLGTLPFFSNQTLTASDTVTLTTPLAVKADKSASIKVLADVSSNLTVDQLTDTFTVALGDGTNAGAAADDIFVQSVPTGVTAAVDSQAGAASLASPDVVTALGADVKVTKATIPNMNPANSAGAEVGRFTITNNGPDDVTLNNLSLADVIGTITTQNVEVFDAETGEAMMAGASAINAQLVLNDHNTIASGKSITIIVRDMDGTAGPNTSVGIRVVQAGTTFTSSAKVAQTIDGSCTGDVVTMK